MLTKVWKTLICGAFLSAVLVCGAQANDMKSDPSYNKKSGSMTTMESPSMTAPARNTQDAQFLDRSNSPSDSKSTYQDRTDDSNANSFDSKPRSFKDRGETPSTSNYRDQ